MNNYSNPWNGKGQLLKGRWLNKKSVSPKITQTRKEYWSYCKDLEAKRQKPLTYKEYCIAKRNGKIK